MELPRIDAVVFDMGGVIVHWDPDDFFRRLSDALNLSERRIREAWTRLQPLFMRGEISSRECLRRLGIEPSGVDLSVEGNPFNRTFQHGVSGRRFEHTLEVVDQLRSGGLTLGVGSNIYAPHAEWIKQRGDFDRFDRLYLSCELGAAKPSDDFFEHILGDLELAPDRIIFLDDTPENVEAARSMGLRAHHYEALTMDRPQLLSLLRSEGSGGNQPP